ncbi:uncharacterized protein [Nicotiana tomentosiformis]|uniref:uncharacterized protein n=1 Tax=Nicotiana tomentosiformis TaxID=4098 RepID=UPI00388CB3BF
MTYQDISANYYYKVTDARESDKLDPRATPCVFIGYPFGKKGYKLYNLSIKTVFVSRDVSDPSSLPCSILSSPDTPSDPPAIPSIFMPSHSSSIPPPEVRRSSKTHTLPSYLNDFVTQLSPSLSSSTSTSLSIAHTKITETHSCTQTAACPA